MINKMNKYLKNQTKKIYYKLMRELPKIQGVLWDRGLPIEQNQIGLDIGCGPRKRSGFIGIDKYKLPDVDILCDFEKQNLPFKDESFDIVYTNHVLEHIVNIEKILSEISRILKPGGKLQIGVPYAGDLRAFQDPTHVRYFSIKTFEYFIKQGSRVGGWYSSKYFKKITKRHLIFGIDPLSLLLSFIVNRNIKLLDFYESSILRIISAKDIQIELEK